MRRVTNAIEFEACVRFVTGFPTMIRHKYQRAILGQHLCTLSNPMRRAELPG